MPALNDYSPLESFLLFKSLEKYGTDPPAFEKIAHLLQNNASLKNQPPTKLNDSRLTANALKGLFDELLRSEFADSTSGTTETGSNGASERPDATQSSKKRKLQSRSPTPVQELLVTPKLLPQLVARLYNRYVESIVRSIRDDEQKYQSLQLEINDDRNRTHNDPVNEERGTLQNVGVGISNPSQLASSKDPRTGPRSPLPQFSINIPGISERDNRRSRQDQNQNGEPRNLPIDVGAASKDSSGDTKDDLKGQAEIRDTRQNQFQSAQQSRGSQNAQALLNRGNSAQLDRGTPKGLSSRVPNASSRYTSPYQPTPVASTQPAESPYGEVSRSSVPAYLRTTTPTVSPKQAPSPTDRQSSQQLRQGPSLPLTPSVVIPVNQASGLRNRSGTRPSPLQTSASSTRWKQSPQTRPRYARGSPEPGEVSPLSDGGQAHTPLSWSSNQKEPTGSETKKDRRVKDLEGQTERRKKDGSKINPTGMSTRRGGSVSSSAAPRSSRGATRSQSVNSHTSFEADSMAGKHVKHEDPPTPLGLDTNQDFDTGDDTPSNNRGRKSGRGRQTALRSLESAFDGIPGTETALKPIRDHPGPDYVYCPKNFSRTTAPILNVINGHRIASLFANPVKERDAPGYKDLIYRPQDLKSIKSAITAGGRAVIALVGSAATPTEGFDSPNAGSLTPSKGGGVWLPASADIVPPRGIVNSAQLEKEVVRIFANAVMFNPDPQRGFGPAFEQETEAGDVDAEDDLPPNHYEEVEGGMVKDTREMFNAVEQSVISWRAVEGASVKPNAERGTDHEHLDDETDDATGQGDRESNADDGGPPTVKRRRRA